MSPEQETDLDLLARLIAAEESAPIRLEADDRARVWERVAPKPRRRLPYPAIAAALAVAAGFVLMVLPAPPLPSDGVKGAAAAPPEIGLRVVAARPSGAALDPERRLADGDLVPPDATLLFELETSGAGARYLFAVDSDGDVVVLWPVHDAATEPAGLRKVATDGGWVALELSDLRGPISLVAASTAAPADVRAEVVGPWVDGRQPPKVAYDAVTIEIGP